MSNHIHHLALVGVTFYSLPPEKRSAVEALATLTIEAHLAGLGEVARFTTPREVYNAIGPSLHRETGVWPRYFYNKIVQQYGFYLASAARGYGISNPFAEKVLTSGPSAIVRADAPGVSLPVGGALAEESLEPSSAVDSDFTPYAALLPGEPSKCSADEFDSMMRDAIVRALRSLINGSPQYGARRAEIDAEFFGSMRWRPSRATTPNRERYEGASAVEGQLGPGCRERRVVVHLRTCAWHLEDNDRSYDFPTLFQEAYGFSRPLAWLIACAMIAVPARAVARSYSSF